MTPAIAALAISPLLPAATTAPAQPPPVWRSGPTGAWSRRATCLLGDVRNQGKHRGQPGPVVGGEDQPALTPDIAAR